MRTWIKSPLAVFTESHIDAGNGFVVDEDKIVEMVPAGFAPAFEVDATIDASGHVVLPGLINTHHHYYQTLTRALECALGKELFAWLKIPLVRLASP
jgi:8-oxoguanine deaminase